MAQLSRPYQVAIGAMAVLALVWFVALRGHSSNPGQPAAAQTPSKPAQSSSSSPGAPSSIYPGPAPGVEGLTRDIAKAHGAVATSERNAAQLQRSSAQASEEATSSAARTSGTRSAQASGTHGTQMSGTHGARAPGTSGKHASGARRTQASAAGSRPRSSSTTHRSSGGGSTATGNAPQQVQVERDIASGKTVLLLFWEPRSSVDNAVRSQVLALQRSSKGKLAVHIALADQVGLFGPVTEVTHVYQTPTVLIVGRHGLVSALSGLVDEFTLRQAVREAQQASG